MEGHSPAQIHKKVELEGDPYCYLALSPTVRARGLSFNAAMVVSMSMSWLLAESVLDDLLDSALGVLKWR